MKASEAVVDYPEKCSTDLKSLICKNRKLFLQYTTAIEERKFFYGVRVP